MRPLLLALLLLLHALAHASAGQWAAGTTSAWIVVPLWLMAMCGFLAASFAIFGLERLRPFVERLTIGATIASSALFFFAGAAVWSLSALLIGAALCGMARWWVRCTRPEIHTPTIQTAGCPLCVDHLTIGRRVGISLSYGMLGLTALLIVVRPWYQSWGTTAAERAASLPGSELEDASRYRIDHGVTVHASARAVWPWVAQIGQDRAGFYSYDWLERAFGDDIRNSDSLVPAWQVRQVGELVPATQPGYLGGRFGDHLGWRVAYWDPPNAMSLENWGTFVVRAVDDSTTRLLVHTRGPGRPSLRALPLGWLGFYLFEPAHFIMERAMLLGVKGRAERSAIVPAAGD